MVTSTHDRESHPAFDDRAVSIVHRISWLVLWVMTTVSVVMLVVGSGFGDERGALGMAMIATAVGFFVLPDLVFVIGAGEPHGQGRIPIRTVPFYNATHRMGAPLLLTMLSGWIAVGSSSPSTISVMALIGGLSWIAHVAIDRAVGFGLRNADGSL